MPGTACDLSYLHASADSAEALLAFLHVCAHMHASIAQVLMVDMEESAIVVKGSIPGKPGGLVEITPHKTVGVNC